jgi:galactofuranose transport system ATP-binding protein
MTPLLRMAGIVKSFPGVQALKGVDFDVRSGQVHALMGENGAGKSTLLKVLTGVYPPDAGEILLEGRRVRPKSPQDATLLGISAVYQELSLAPNLSVAENICIGREPRGWGGIRWREVRQRAIAALRRLGVETDVDRPIGSCPPAVQHLVAIARALDVEAKVLVLDEPTSSLDRDETENLFRVVERLKAEGLGIVYVTHFLDEVYAIADEITVLRNGALVGRDSPARLPKRGLVSLMIGREAPPDAQSEVRLEVRAAGPEERAVGGGGPEPLLTAINLGRDRSVSGLSFQLEAGEVLGLAGLLGSGRTESVRLLFGVDAPDQGTLLVRGRQVRLTPGRAIREGIGMSPEERKSEAIFPNLSVRENMIIVVQRGRGWLRPLRRSEGARRAGQMIDDLRIATPDSERPIAQLSGGNQQKALLGRWLLARPDLLLLDEPTRGIDVGAKFEIALLIERLRAAGMAFVLVSSELTEVVRNSTKVAILRDRTMVAELGGDEVREDAIFERIAEGGR